MWAYEKRLQYPVKIRKTCPKTAQLIISQYGGPDGELSASMRYLAQRYSMPVKKVGGLLTDIGTEEINHMEIICAIVYQLTKDLTPEQAKAYAAEGQFAPGSMLPKVEAAVKFAESKPGREALITLLEKARDGIAGKTGTIVRQ